MGIDAARLRVAQALAASARAHRFEPDNPQAHAAARQDLLAARLELAVLKTLANAPPLTREQADRILRLLVAPHPEGDR